MPFRAGGSAYLALIAVCFFWGTTYLGIRMALESFPPATLIGVRYILSGGILLIALRLRRAHIPRGRELLISAVCGVLIIGAGNGALTWAELTIPSGLASLFITLQPFWFVIFEALLPGGTRPHAPTVAGMVVGFFGAVLLFLPGAGSSHFEIRTLIGFLVLQLGCVGWCVGALLQKRQLTRAHPVVTGAVQQLACAVVFLPLSLLIPHGPIVLKARAVGALAYLVVFGSIVGYSAFVYSMAKLPVAVVSIYSYVNAAVAVTLGWLVYREPFGPREWAAMALIFTGVAIVKRQSARTQARQAEAKAA